MPLVGRRSSGLSGRERAAMRRQLRTLEQLREEQLLDLGGLALEMHRRDQIEADLLMSRAEELAAVEEEIELIGIGLERGLPPAEVERRMSASRGSGQTR